MQTEIDPRDLIGHKAVDKHGEKIGTVDEVYLDDATGEPEWAAVRTGLFGRDAFVPLTTSEFVSDELRVPYEKSQVKDSPDFGVGQHLSPAQELQLYRYYGLEVPTGTGQHAADSGARLADKSTQSTAAASAAAGAGPDGAGAPPKTAMAGTAGAAGTAAAGAAAGMAAGAAGAAGAAAKTEEKPVERTLSSTPVVEPLSSAGRTSSFLTGTAPKPDISGPAGAAAAAAPAAAAMSTPAVQAPPAAPFPGTTGTTDRTGAIDMTRTSAATDAQRRPDPLTDPLPGMGIPATSTSAKDPVPEPVEFVCREERLDISTEWRVLGRARLRKYVTTEQVERRVPVVRERIRVERVPVSAEERAQLTEAEIAESVEEVTLHEERLVVRKTIVPVERIRLVTERITEEEVVREQLHREHIQVQDGSRPAGTPVTPPAAGAPLGGPPLAGTPAAAGIRQATPMGHNPDLPDHAMGA
ncbi:uncharacterized protein (TIGR02271 family) [Streptacidiphilus sp. MAP12-20]|uniref:PRC and DUF2382 domain-containing protein n=1 Tax=Streptacidiphilus sp. MAP12-20 TaxID=3156299 RepID=UPI00351491A8